MKGKLIAFCAISIIFNSCFSKCEYKGSYRLSDSLILEYYETYDAGVWGESTDCYITDSVSFRKKIGSRDEHDILKVSQLGDKLNVYNIESSLYPDTVAIKRISMAQLYKKQYSDSRLLNEVPVFGHSTMECDSSYKDYGAHRTNDGYYISQIQYHCGNNFFNAVYYTDSSRFRIFIGIYVPGSHSNNYSVKLDSNDFIFYNVEDKYKFDTVKRQTYLLSELKKGSMRTVCH